MSFRRKVRIYFDQGDPANIAFHGQHTIITQRVMEEYVIHLGIPWVEWYKNKELFMPAVEFLIKFKKPLYPGKEYFVDIKFIKRGRSSITGEFKISSLTNEICCEINAVYVCVDSVKFKSMEFPKAWRAILDRAISS